MAEEITITRVEGARLMASLNGTPFEKVDPYELRVISWENKVYLFHPDVAPHHITAQGEVQAISLESIPNSGMLLRGVM